MRHQDYSAELDSEEFAQMSKEELEEELRALGIDPDKEIERGRQAIERAIAEAKL